jgi:aldehyde dehydrogenase (NAD+)
MGGKSPLIVLKDADLDYAVDAAVFGIFLHQGQVCMVNSRMIVEADIYDQFCEKLAAKTRTLKVGDPRQPDTVIGPLVESKQCPFIKGQLDEAVAAGARLLYGGSYEGGFFQPTIIADVTDTMRIFQEESFGPVACVIKAADSEEALAIANNSSFGLSSAIITNDLQKAFDLSLRIEAGMVHINNCSICAEPHVPFGGIKDSGIGREGGHYSIEEMTEIKWITVQLGKRQFPF